MRSVATYFRTMATIEINRKTHRTLRTFSTLESRMHEASETLDKIAEPAKWDVLNTYLVDLSQGLEEVKFLALVSDYLLGIQRERSQLRLENDLLRDELAYVRGKMVRAEEMVVTLEEDRKCIEFTREMARFDAALSGDIDFEASIEEWMVNEDDLISDDEDNDEAEEATKHDALFDGLFTRAVVDDLEATFDGDQTILLDQSTAEHDESFRTETTIKYFNKYMNEGRYDIAEPLCHAMIAELQHSNDANKRDLAVALELLAMADRQNERYIEAAENLKLALQIYEETLDADHPIIVATLNHLAMLYAKCEQYELAEPLCERALHIQQSRADACHPHDVARQHSNMAIVHQQRRSYDAAIRHYKKALNIYATHADTSETVAATDKTKRRMATAMCHQQRFAEAGAVYKDILTPKQKHVKVAHPQKPIWEVAEELERMSASQRKTVDSYELQYDYRDWYDCIQVYLPNAFGALKKLAFVYRKMNMHIAAKMLEHLCNITDRKKMQLKYAPARVCLSPQSLGAASPRPHVAGGAAARSAAVVVVPAGDPTSSSSTSSSTTTGSISHNERSI